MAHDLRMAAMDAVRVPSCSRDQIGEITAVRRGRGGRPRWTAMAEGHGGRPWRMTMADGRGGKS
jgi:hypothetical protein